MIATAVVLFVFALVPALTMSSFAGVNPIEKFLLENEGKMVRRIPPAVLPENAFFMIHGPSLAKGAENANAALMEMLAEKGTYNFITLTLRCHPELGDAEIVAEVKKVIEVAHRHGIQVGVDIDPRIARREFLRRWPDEMQRVVVAAKGETYASGRAQATLVAKTHGDHMCAGSSMGYDPASASPLVAYAVRFSGDAIVPGSARKVPVKTVANSTFKLVVEAEGLADGETLVAFGEFRLFSCDVYSEHLLPFTRELMERYKGYGADGAMRDEWGFPSPSEDGFRDGRAFWYSPGYAAAYAKRTGRNLVDDFIVMAYPAQGDDSLRRRLAGEYMYLNFLRNAEIEEDMYATSKRLWGADCYVAKHPTWYAQLEYHNIWHDGIDWWRAKRDWAQSDETVPRCALLGMMRKFGGPNWMNEWYAGTPASYQTNIWRYAVAGARMVVHPLFGPNPWKMFPDDPVRANCYYHEPILTPDFIRAQGRIRLLNLMTRGQVVSQAAVVFGHKRAINFTDEKTWLPGESDLGIKNWRTIDWGGGLAADFWKAGYFADLFPSDEFSYGTFTVDADGYLRAGTQAYPVVVFTHLDADDVAAFRRLADGKALRTKVFAWDASELPGATKLAANESVEAIAYLDSIKAIRQPKAVGKRESWSKAWQGDILPLGDGTTMLTDGTVQRVKGAVNDIAGDDIAGTLDLGNAKVEYVAKGVFAARADKDGRLAGLAAGGATRVKGLGIDLTLKTPEDFALYRLAGGRMAGVWQTTDGSAEVPAELKPLAESWTKLILPNQRISIGMSYLDIMERAVSAYSDEHMASYLAEAETDGVQEHGFPRLTANLGVLVANGRLKDKKGILARMMTASCRDAARGKMKGWGGGNDFSVKELAIALRELERAKTYPADVLEGWRADLTRVVAEKCYSALHAVGDTKYSYNWCVFGAASEQARLATGLGGDRAFVEKYVADQLRWFDEKGMWRDPQEPAVYDLVTRLQFAAILHYGYDGASKAKLEDAMDRGSETALKLLSACGEIPYGGRSNQFLLNNTLYSALCEWYAARFAARGETAKAQRFKAAARKSLDALQGWFSARPLRHVKNLYPQDSGLGCEGYAYFNKYMVTMGSWAMMAREFAIDIPAEAPATVPGVFETSPCFHWVFMEAGDYSAQFDYAANLHYDCNGLGRIHRRGAPPQICLSVPCAKDPAYRIAGTNQASLAIAPVADGDLELVKRESTADCAMTEWKVGKQVWRCMLSAKGMEMTLSGPDEVALSLPVFEFDGESKTEIEAGTKRVAISYRGWRCVYETDGTIVRTAMPAENRNGRYVRFEARGRGTLRVKVAINQKSLSSCNAEIWEERKIK